MKHANEKRRCESANHEHPPDAGTMNVEPLVRLTGGTPTKSGLPDKADDRPGESTHPGLTQWDQTESNQELNHSRPGPPVGFDTVPRRIK